MLADAKKLPASPPSAAAAAAAAAAACRFKVKEFLVREIVPYPIQLSWEGDATVAEGDAGERRTRTIDGKRG